jgi:hypothetical protein
MKPNSIRIVAFDQTLVAEQRAGTYSHSIPGSMADTEIPNCCNSKRIVSVIASMPNLLAQYGPIRPAAVRPAHETILTIRPLLSRSSGSNTDVMVFYNACISCEKRIGSTTNCVSAIVRTCPIRLTCNCKFMLAGVTNYTIEH